MINSKQLLDDFILKINDRSDPSEVAAQAFRIFENLFGITHAEVLQGKLIAEAPDLHEKLTSIAARINQHEPIQYILNEAYFYNRRFFVSDAVLIPRPETEELVSLVLQYLVKENLSKPVILDVGTGSGCIPITLSLEMPGAEIYALDKSEQALAVAMQNAKDLKAQVRFFHSDFLSETVDLPQLDLIISNPPYIAQREKNDLHKNVTAYEPHIALFVEDNDPLVFYKAIAKATHLLKPNGFVAVEINERFGMETQQVFATAGFIKSEIVKDLSGKDRFVFARRV